jgi:hypothetical protein
LRQALKDATQPSVDRRLHLESDRT